MEDPNAKRRAEIERFFTDEHLCGEPVEVASPSGRYRLTIRTYQTGPNTWDFSRGTVVRIADGVTVCDIKRNYGQFAHTFVVKDGREYLITGRSYMSQTIIDLDRSQEHEPEGDHYDGGAFCWVRCWLSSDGNTLVVDGCVWACPYEYRFFDFSDPARGWPELPIAGGEGVDEPSDAVEPKWLDARTVECHQMDNASIPQERTRLERRGAEMVVIEHWVSEPEQLRREAEAQADAEQELWWAAFSQTNPMYLRLVELVRTHRLPDDKLDLQPLGRRCIKQYFRRHDPRASADLEWDLDEATIRVQLYDAEGNAARELSFPHAIEGIEAAVHTIAGAFDTSAPSTGRKGDTSST